MPFLDLHVGRPRHRGARSLFPAWSTHAVAQPAHDLDADVCVAEPPGGGGVASSLVVTDVGLRPALLLAGELVAA